jgi:hypothetical protein
MGPFRAKPDRAAPAARSLAVVDRLRLHGSVGWYLGTCSPLVGSCRRGAARVGEIKARS